MKFIPIDDYAKKEGLNRKEFAELIGLKYGTLHKEHEHGWRITKEHGFWFLENPAKPIPLTAYPVKP